MDEVASLMEWDLQTIVKGCNNSEEAPVGGTITDDNNLNLYLNSSHHHNFSSQQQDDLFFNFHEFSETTTWVLDELEELYKPFYPVLQNNHPTSPLLIPQETEQPKVHRLKLASEHLKVTAQDSKEPAASKYKRRSKKNEKRRVEEVTEAEAYSDGWAWRKYGQKAIKGSPYPRSYYRCSSSKGCLSRKQVERSSLDPQLFIVTYTAEHAHPKPTRRRNSSTPAGSTRKNSHSTAIIAASSRTVVDKSVVEDQAECGNWFQSIELEEELNGLELDGLQLDLDGYFDDEITWFNSSIDLT